MALKIKAVFVNWGYMSSTPSWPQTLPLEYVVSDADNTALELPRGETTLVVQSTDSAAAITSNAVAQAKSAEAALGRTITLP